MIEKVLNRKNLYKAYRQVVRNKGSAGVDKMPVSELFSYLESNRDRIIMAIPRAMGRSGCLGFQQSWKDGSNRQFVKC